MKTPHNVKIAPSFVAGRNRALRASFAPRYTGPAIPRWPIMLAKATIALAAMATFMLVMVKLVLDMVEFVLIG